MINFLKIYEQLLSKKAQKLGPKQRDLIVEMEKESLKTLKENGVEIIEDVDIAPFQEAVQPIYAQIEYQDLLNQILDAQ